MTNSFHGPRSRQNARLLVEAARGLGYPTSVVKTTVGGYMVPQDILDAALGVSGVEEGVVYPAPPEGLAEERTEVADEVGKPRGNHSREAWAEYAEGIGLEITDDLSRDDIKNLVNEEE